MVRADGFAAAAMTVIVSLAAVTGCSSGRPDTATGSMITSTTKIAGAGVLGNQRRPDESCAPEPARTDPGAPTRVRNASSASAQGTNAPGINAQDNTAQDNTAQDIPDSTEVTADPQRIVVLSGDQLDALCALGLQSRIVGAAVADGTDTQPSYLGTVVHDLPAVGTRSAPDLESIATARPDLILGSAALTPTLYPRLAEIAPTVFAAAPGAAWQDNLRTVGAATTRAEAADDLIEKFVQHAAHAGAADDATHFQASVVQLTEDTVRVYGSANFAAGVLKTVGLGRPAAQRFTDRPYLEIGTANLAKADFSAADGDIVYVSFASPAAKARADAVFDSPAWRRLSAYHDNRVFAVNNEVWQTGRGLIAARGIVDDLRWLNAPIN